MGRASQDGNRAKDNSHGEEEHGPQPPTYQQTVGNPSESANISNVGPSTAPLGPTISSPFTFPSTNLPLQVDPTPSASRRPIAIPQRYPDPASPFLAAYPPALLRHGIPSTTWYSFVDTISAFLTARAGKRAIAHASDIAARIGKLPQQFGKDTVNHAKTVVKDIGKNAKDGNVFGVVGGAIGGTVGLTAGTAARLVGSVLSLPGNALATAANPQTPRGRAEAYAAAANKDWLYPRGLQLSLMTTEGLCNLVGVPVAQVLDTVNSQSASASAQLRTLRDIIEDVDIQGEQVDEQPGATPISPGRSPADVKKGLDEPAASTSVGEASSSAEGSSSKVVSLNISAQTLWLVVETQTSSKE